MQKAPYTVSEAFNSQLKALCIKEFPCGFGTWRLKDIDIPTKATKLQSRTEITPVSRNEQTAQYETIEDLQELSMKAPYNNDCSWSNEASLLREIAVKTPNKLSEDFILNNFKSLRIIDKKVTEIDEGLLKFKNLKQFTLSANLVSDVNSKNLPSELQELELSANQITDMTPLCISPPSLIHLGLGYNNISNIPIQMKPEAWGHLLSLDMSYNNLLDLNSTINILKQLPKLRNLVLQGNPLMLVPGYRGYVIDSIRQLTILDDNRISADEKHYFKGLSKLKGIPLDRSRLTIAVSSLTGVRLNEELEDQESQPEFPKIVFKYHVEFMFIESPVEKSASTMDSKSTTPLPRIPEKPAIIETFHKTDENTKELKLIATNSQPWSEEAIEIDYSKDFITTRLCELKEFFKKGMDLNVIETKHSYVQEDPNAAGDDDDGKMSTYSGKDGKQDKRKKSGKDKPDKRKESAKQKDKGKGKGKGKQDESDLFELPREHKLLGSYHVKLSTLVDGESEIKLEAKCEEVYSKTDESKSVTSGKQEGSEKKKSTKGEAEKNTKGSKAGESKKGGKDGKKGGKDEKGKGKNTKEDETVTDGDEEFIPPPPLAINFSIKLHHWKSAREATLACEAITDKDKQL